MLGSRMLDVWESGHRGLGVQFWEAVEPLQGGVDSKDETARLLL